MTGKPEDHDGLESLFFAARSRPEAPDADLMARVLASAEAEQDVHMRRADANALADKTETGESTAHSPDKRRVSGFWQSLSEAAARVSLDHAPLRTLGGWPVAAGFAAVTCAGIWLGTLPQSPISSSGLFVVSDAGIALEAWGDVTAFGLVDGELSDDSFAETLSGEGAQ